jgi:hypothetical protein
MKDKRQLQPQAIKEARKRKYTHIIAFTLWEGEAPNHGSITRPSLGQECFLQSLCQLEENRKGIPPCDI